MLNDNKVIIKITYQNANPWKGHLLLENKQDHYYVNIDTISMSNSISIGYDSNPMKLSSDEIDELPKSAAILNQEGVQLGVIAQEVQDFLPQIINEESTGCLSVDGSDIKWLLVNAVKQLSSQVEDLKAEIKTLKGE